MSIHFVREDTTIPFVTIGDILHNNHSWELCKIVTINTNYAWFEVCYLSDNHKRRHTMSPNGGNQSFTKITEKERADLFLALENAGITDDWQD